MMLLCQELLGVLCVVSSACHSAVPLQERAMSLSSSGQIDFSFDLARAIVQPEDTTNSFFSPFSIWSALGLLTEGARGETAGELLEALSGGAEPFDLVALRLTAQDQTRRLESAGEHVELRSANALWSEADTELDPRAVAALREYYGAQIETLDFRTRSDQARVAINDWVAARTAGHIEELLPPGSVTPLTRLVLTNAVYFLGLWSKPFDEQATLDLPFRRTDGSSVQVPFLRDGGGRRMPVAFFDEQGAPRSEPRAQRGGFSAFELEYEGGQIVLLGLVPDDVDGLAKFEAGLNAERLASITAELTSLEVTFAMPKLDFRSNYDLVPIAKRLGIVRAFSEQDSDLSGFTHSADPKLYVTGAFHQAFLKLDESGTEAAAATGVVVGVRSMPMRKPDVRVDRPFLCLLRERESGAILFLGRVLDPSAD